MRHPVVAGQFYPKEKNQLLASIKECFLHELGVGYLPNNSPNPKSKNNLKAIISPHAGYVFSGPCMSHVFSEIARARTPDAYIVIGVSHYGFETSLSDEDFETPLGVLKNNTELTGLISRSCNIEIRNHNHKHEHSLEVLLPFLQFVKGSEVTIVPLIIGQEDLKKIKELGNTIKSTLSKSGKDVVFLVSSDFTHFGANYGYYPNEQVEKLDKKAINFILKASTEELFDFYQETGVTICGIFPIMVLLESIDFSKSQLLSYYTSSQIMSMNESSSVSYAAVSFHS